jgi:hypothetical protein
MPGWISGAHGNVGAGGRVAQVHEDFTDILDILRFIISLNLEVRKERWLFFLDGLYLETSDTVALRAGFWGCCLMT